MLKRAFEMGIIRHVARRVKGMGAAVGIRV